MQRNIIRGGIDIVGFRDNVIFDLNSPQNRDNGFQSWVKLKSTFSDNNIRLDTSDRLKDIIDILDFEIHVDCREKTYAKRNYLLMLESHLIKPINAQIKLWQQYRKVFTWRDDLVDGDQFIKINFPQELNIPAVNGWSNRTNLCCLIAGNKSLARIDKRDLYVERIKTIRWFEKNAEKSLNLYGTDWDIPTIGRGLSGKVLRVIFKKLKRLVAFKPLKTYKGTINNKADALLTTKFNICYENVSDLPGYITEKIFDSFHYGCVPVYWGANNISEHIPPDCYIDRRLFKNTEDLYHHLKSITEIEYIGYQERIANFLKSPAAQPFSASFFAETIVNTIVKDLEVKI